MTKIDLQECVVKALKELGGRGSIVEIAKVIDNTYKKEQKPLETFTTHGTTICAGQQLNYASKTF